MTSQENGKPQQKRTGIITERENQKKRDKRAALLQLNGMKLDVAKSASELYTKKRHAAEEYNRFQLITDCGVYMSYVARTWREKEKLTCYFCREKKV